MALHDFFFFFFCEGKFCDSLQIIQQEIGSMPAELNRKVKVQNQQLNCAPGVGRDSVIFIIYFGDTAQ